MREFVTRYRLIALLTICVSQFHFISGGHAFNEDNANATILHYEVDTSELRKGEGIDTTNLLRSLHIRLGTTGRARFLDNRQIEIHVNGQPDHAELEMIKLRIIALGHIEFRYTADQQRREDRIIIEQARLLPLHTKELIINGSKVAEWVAYSEKEFDPSDAPDHRLVKRVTGTVSEALVMANSLHLTGEYLTSAKKGVDKHGRHLIDFSFNRKGSSLLRKLTSEENTNRNHEESRLLGFVLDNRLLGGTPIRKMLHKNVQIGGMTENAVDAVIAIVHAGMLSYPLEDRSVKKPCERKDADVEGNRNGDRESAGINRLGIGNERVLQRRPSQLLWPRTVRWQR